MYELTLDLAVIFFFLAFLFFIFKQKEGYFEYYPQSWKALMLGGIFLVLAFGTDLASILIQRGHAFASRWQEIIRGTGLFGYIAGGALILFGLVKWCHSLVGVKNNATERLRQVTCLKSVLSIVNHHRELDEILKQSLPTLMNIMQYKIGVIFKHTFNSSKMVLAAHQGVPAENLFTLFDLYSKNIWYRESSKSQEIGTTTDVKSLPEYGALFSDQEEIRSFACVPIKFCGKVLGLMGLYDSQSDRFSYQEIQFLTSVGETLGLAAKQNLVCDRNKKRRDYISAVENMLKMIQESNSLEEAFPKISAELKRIIDFDHISLALATGSGQSMKRISIGSSGGVLVDRRAGVRTEGNALGEVIRSEEMRIDRNVDLSGNSSEDALIKACGIKSRIVLPLWSQDSICGSLSLGHKKPNFYSANDAKWLRLLTLTLSHVLSEQRLKEKLERERSLSRSLYEFDNKLAGEEDLITLLQDATSSITSNLPRSLARVTLLSKKKDQLINCAVHQIRSEGIDIKKEERFFLDDLPWHRLTLEAKRPMMINQDDPESVMSKKEARLIMDEKVSSAFLVPLILNDKAVGIVSVGEMRSWDRQPLTEEEIAFVKHKANQVCLALRKGILRRSNEQLKDRLKYSYRPKKGTENQTKMCVGLSDLSYKITNPLTSIRGSVELLRRREPDLSSDSLRYLRNVDIGVDRIQKTLEEFLNSAYQERESRVNQPTEQLVSG